MWPNAKLDLRQEYTVTHQGNPKTRHQKRFKWIKHSAANKPLLTLQFADWFLLTDTLSTPPLTCTLFSHRHTLHTLTHRHTLHTLTHRQTHHTFTHRNTPLTGRLSTPDLHSQEYSTHRQTLHITRRHTHHTSTHKLRHSLSLLTHTHSQHFYSKLYLSNTFTNGDSLHVSPSRHISTFTNTQPRIVSHCQIRCKVC